MLPSTPMERHVAPGSVFDLAMPRQQAQPPLELPHARAGHARGPKIYLRPWKAMLSHILVRTEPPWVRQSWAVPRLAAPARPLQEQRTQVKLKAKVLLQAIWLSQLM